MATALSSSGLLPSAALLADYDQWLLFLTASQHTIRHYKRQLTRIERRNPHLSPLSNYLLDCMHQRSQFFKDLAALLGKEADKLRLKPDNEIVIKRLNRVHPVMQNLLNQLMQAFADLTESYRMLPVSILAPGTLSLVPPISLQ